MEFHTPHGAGIALGANDSTAGIRHIGSILPQVLRSYGISDETPGHFWSRGKAPAPRLAVLPMPGYEYLLERA